MAAVSSTVFNRNRTLRDFRDIYDTIISKDCGPALDIHRHLGLELDLEDPYSGGPYVTDAETGLAMSVGPDGEAGTEDDIMSETRRRR